MHCTRPFRPALALVLFLVACAVSGQQIGPPSPCHIATLEQQAASGNAKAGYDLGQCYAIGNGVPVDLAESTRWFGKAAEQGLVIAQSRFANALLNGWGVTQSTSEAMAWYQKAAKHGDTLSAYMLGELYEAGGPIEAIKQPDGTFIGGPVPQSAGIPKDFARAAYWYRVAANQGGAAAPVSVVANAQNSLGRLYALGEGVPQDYREAYFWLSLAEANGNTSATDGVDDRDLAASHLTKAALLQEQERARKWFEHRPTRVQ